MNLWGFIHTNGVTPGQFGKITIDCASQSSPMCTAQLSAIKQMIASEAPYVQSLVNSSQAAAGSSSTSATNKAATNGPSLTDPTIVNAATAYDAAMSTAEQQIVAQAHPALMAAMNNINTSVTHLGWWSLGMYYWDIAHVNAGIQAKLGKMPRWSGYNQAAINKAMSSKSDRKTFAKIDAAAAAGVQAANSSAGLGTGSSLLTRVFSSEGAWYTKMSPWSLTYGSGGKSVDPLAALQMAGDLIVTAEIPTVIGAYVTLRAETSAGKNAAADADVPIADGIAGAGAGALNGAAKAIGSYVMALVIGIFVVGAIWAYYLPSVPFIIWTMGLLGWLIFLIEALVGAVVWAAGIALPEGEGIFGPRGDQGVMLFLNVMFRPALMVIGFFASFILIGIVGPIIGGSFGVFMGGMYTAAGSSVTGSPSLMSTVMTLNPITWIASSVVLTIIMLITTHKVFGLVTWIPENVFRWVGGQGMQLGEEAAEGQTRTMFAGFASSKGGAITSTMAKGAKEGEKDAARAAQEREKGAENQGGADAAQGGNFKKNDVADGGEQPPQE